MKDSEFNKHEHDENCDCCNTISIPMEDGSELVCDILGTFDLEDVSYIVLLPQGDEEILIYKYSEEPNEQILLETIDSNEELEKVVEAFYELYSDSDFEFDENFDDDDDDDDDDDGEFDEDFGDDYDGDYDEDYIDEDCGCGGGCGGGCGESEFDDDFGGK